MTTLSIDQSFTHLAFIIINDQNELIEYGILTSNKEQDIYKRALDLSLRLVEICNKYTPSEIRLEGLAFGMRGSSTRDLGGLLFTIVNIISHVYKFDNFKIISPKTIKKRATGSGKATKKQMIAALPQNIIEAFKDQNFKLTTGLADLADAYWLSQCII